MTIKVQPKNKKELVKIIEVRFKDAFKYYDSEVWC